MPVNLSMKWAPSAVTSFVGRAEEFLLAHGPDKLSRLQAEFTALFSQRETITAICNRYLQRVVDGVIEDAEFVGKDSLLVRYAPHMVLRIIKDRSDVTAFSANPTRFQLTNYPSNSLVLFITPGPVRVDWYCLEQGASFDRFDGSLKIRYEAREYCQSMQSIYVDAARRFPVFPACEGSVYVVLSGAPAASQIVSFEDDTLRPLGASMASDITSILCVMLDLVKKRDHCPAALDAIRELARHPDHHVRWTAASVLGRFDAAAALQLARAMAACDPHVFIRDAARRTLAQTEGAVA